MQSSKNQNMYGGFLNLVLLMSLCFDQDFSPVQRALKGLHRSTRPEIMWRLESGSGDGFNVVKDYLSLSHTSARNRVPR